MTVRSLVGKDKNDAITEHLIYGTIEIALLKPGRLAMRSIWVLYFFSFVDLGYHLLLKI